MAIALGAVAPDFTAESTMGTLSLHDYVGDEWCLFFSHPRDFSAVCMTELARVSELKPELDKRKAKALGLSIVELGQHTRWSGDFGSALGCELNFPLIADPKGEVATLYGMIHPEHAAGVTARAVFLIDPAKKIRMFAMYPTSTGRNFEELLRILDSLQLTKNQGLVTPAGWKPGEPAVIPPAIPDADAEVRFPGYRALTSYLRLVLPPGETK